MFYFKCFVIIIFDDEMGYWGTFWLIYQTYECFPLKFDCSGRISKIYKIKDHVYLAGLMDILLTVMVTLSVWKQSAHADTITSSLSSLCYTFPIQYTFHTKTSQIPTLIWQHSHFNITHQTLKKTHTLHRNKYR